MEKFSWRKEHMDEYSWKISTFLCSCIWFRDCEQIFIQYFKNNSHPLTSRGKSASPRTVRGATCSSEKREAVQVQELRLRSLSCVDWTFLWELTAYIAYITRGQGYLLRCHVLRQGYTTWYFKPLHQNPVSLSIGGPEQFYLYSESGLFCAQTIRASGSRMMGWALKWKHAAQHWRLHKQLYQESLL